MSTNQHNGSELQQQTTAMSVLCVICCEFYGTTATESMCSKCYREVKGQHEQDVATQKLAAGILSREAEKQNATAEVRVEVNTSTPTEVVSVSPVVEEEVKMETDEKKVQKNKSRCWSCNKKIGLTGFKCKCDYLFCGSHRHAEDHECSFDHREAHKQHLTTANPLVVADKLEKI